MYLYTECPPHSRNELKNKFGVKTVFRDIAYRMYNFAVIESLLYFSSAINVPNKPLHIIVIV
jgi:hypothetical protein